MRNRGKYFVKKTNYMHINKINEENKNIINKFDKKKKYSIFCLIFIEKKTIKK